METVFIAKFNTEKRESNFTDSPYCSFCFIQMRSFPFWFAIFGILLSLLYWYQFQLNVRITESFQPIDVNDEFAARIAISESNSEFMYIHCKTFQSKEPNAKSYTIILEAGIFHSFK